MKLWLDTETVGLCGPCKLIQYAIDDGPVLFIPLMKGWETDYRACAGLDAVEAHLREPTTTFIGFNTSFDLYHLYRTLHRRKGLPYDSPERPIQPFACKVLDLQTHAIRNSPLSAFAFSKGGAKSVAAVRRIPRVVASVVRDRVEARLRPLLPAVCELKCSEHEVPGKKDLVTLSWHTDTRLSLKNLMQVYGLPTLRLAEVWPLPEKGTEKQHLPYPTEVYDALEPMCDLILGDRTLPFWKYAELDILYLRVLYERLGMPSPDHHDTCTHAVAYTRYYGFGLDRPVLLRTRDAYAAKVESARSALAGVDLASPKQRLALLKQHDPLIASSSRKVIEVLAKSDRPSAPIAQAMIDFGMFTQRLNQVEKVLECRTGKAHPDFRVMGTRTGRMAGTAGLNWQGIPKAKKGIGIRAAMEVGAVGDWSAFEVAIAAAVFPDKSIQEDLDKGIDQHTMNAVLMSPEVKKLGWDYPTMKALVDAKDDVAIRIRSGVKGCSFALQYFAAAPKIAEVLGVSLEEGEKALSRYYARYAGFCAYRNRIEKETQTADTEHWSPDSVARMAREVTDMTGHRMSWDFEAQVATALWALGGQGIRTGKDGMVMRTPEKGLQTYDGAVKSALLGGAIAIQAAVSRQRGNAAVQSAGAQLTKMLMANIWEKFRVPVANCHDELFFPRCQSFTDAREGISQEIEEFTALWKRKIPSLFFDYHCCSHWSDK